MRCNNRGIVNIDKVNTSDQYTEMVITEMTNTLKWSMPQ